MKKIGSMNLRDIAELLSVSKSELKVWLSRRENSSSDNLNFLTVEDVAGRICI